MAWEFFPLTKDVACRKKICVKMSYFIKISMITILFSKFLVDFLRNNIRRFGFTIMCMFGELKVAFLRAVILNPLSANITKWSNTLKQFIGNLPTNCLSVFDYFVELALKGLKSILRGLL